MTHPLSPIVEYLETVAPFDLLDESARGEVARHLEIEYYRRGSRLRVAGEPAACLYVVRSGALSEVDEAALLVNKYAEGDLAGVDDLLSGGPSRTSLIASEDSLLYRLAALRFDQLLEAHPPLQKRFAASLSERLRQATRDLARSDPHLGSITVPVGALLRRPLVSMDADQSITAAAQLMSEQGVSCLVLRGSTSLGVVTDRDLRTRVLARGRSADEPLRNIMTSPAITIDTREPVFAALVLMLEKEIHHLVVTEDDAAVGVVTTTDLVRAHSENPVLLVGEINKQTTFDGVARANRKRRDVLVRLVASGARASDVHRVLSKIADAVTRRLLQLTENDLSSRGLGPVPSYCWTVFGSQAREELNLGSDQDNALILSPPGTDSDPAAQFLATEVCEGLALCGYPKCSGGIMAMTPKWRKPVPVWESYFRHWIRSPERAAVMHASIFFDFRAIGGEAHLMDSLSELVHDELRDFPLFLAHMARDAMARRPPLGLFRRFVLEKNGEHESMLDLKHRGLVPIVDLARVLALEVGYTGPHTLRRLQAARDGGTLSSSGHSDLETAYEFISLLRLRHQADALSEGREADSFLDPAVLSSSDRRHLREAFEVIKTVQDAIAVSHQLGGLSG